VQLIHLGTHRTQLKLKKWMDLKVGDIVLLKKNDEIPADLIILATSDENGEAYI
jgi:magnesium-transporting ATPase (P-type)